MYIRFCKNIFVCFTFYCVSIAVIISQDIRKDKPSLYVNNNKDNKDINILYKNFNGIKLKPQSPKDINFNLRNINKNNSLLSSISNKNNTSVLEEFSKQLNNNDLQTYLVSYFDRKNKISINNSSKFDYNTKINKVIQDFPHERRNHNTNIRHQKSRKSFVRIRKSPRTRVTQAAAHKFNPNHDKKSYFSQIKDDDDDINVELTSEKEIKKYILEKNHDVKKSKNQKNSEDSKISEEGKSRGVQMDVVTKFLRIVESQHLLGENCTKGTDFHLGEGVVDRYAQERFKLEAKLAVNRANLYTRLWKYSKDQVLASEYLLHAEVLSIVEFDEDIFAAGNCYDKYEYKGYMLFCPYAYRLPEGLILVKDLAVEYKYLTETSEWFFISRNNAERIIRRYNTVIKGYHSYTYNDSAHTEREEKEILAVTYEDGDWSKPYFDCGGGNIWMMTYSVPFFGYANGTYYYKGTSAIDIDLRRVDIDQCPSPSGSQTPNIFANSDKCKEETTKCVSIKGLGFRRGSYKCVCKKGFYFPDFAASKKYYNGSHIEEEYEKKMLGEPNLYDEESSYVCLPCAEGCDECESPTPCIVTLNWVMRTVILITCLIIILSLPAILFFTWKYGNLKVVRAASPLLLRMIIVGAFFIYCTTLVLYPIPNVISCSARVWLREIGFSLAYGALMLKTWRISVIFRVRSAKAVKITDLDLMKRLGIIVGVFSVFLGIRTVVAPPQVIVSMTADDLKAFLCSTDWWDYSFTFMELMFLVWGIRLCIVVRKAPSEFNESKFISMAIYNEFLLSLFLNVSMLFLQSPANPDLLYIIFFCHTQLTITPLIALIFGSKVFMVLKGLGKGEESISMTKPITAKFIQKPKSNSHIMGSNTSSSGFNLEHSDIQDEFRKIFLHLESLKERNMRLGNIQIVSRITAMQEAAATTAFPSKDPSVKEDKSPQLEVPKSRLERHETKVSDGVVIKPYVNSILANVTDKIVCATFQDTNPEILVGKVSNHQCIKISNLENIEQGIGREPNVNLMLGAELNSQKSCDFSSSEPNINLKEYHLNLYVHDDASFRCIRNDSLSECGSPISLDSLPSPNSTDSDHNFDLEPKLSYHDCEEPRQKLSDIIYPERRRSAFCFREKRKEKQEKVEKINTSSLRSCKSLETLPLEKQSTSNPNSVKTLHQTDDEWRQNLWSCQSTPRHHQNETKTFNIRELGDAVSAAANILYSLSGEQTSLTGEISV